MFAITLDFVTLRFCSIYFTITGAEDIMLVLSTGSTSPKVIFTSQKKIFHENEKKIINYLFLNYTVSLKNYWLHLFITISCSYLTKVSVFGVQNLPY